MHLPPWPDQTFPEMHRAVTWLVQMSRSGPLESRIYPRYTPECSGGSTLLLVPVKFLRPQSVWIQVKNFTLNQPPTDHRGHWDNILGCEWKGKIELYITSTRVLLSTPQLRFYYCVRTQGNCPFLTEFKLSHKNAGVWKRKHKDACILKNGHQLEKRYMVDKVCFKMRIETWIFWKMIFFKGKYISSVHGLRPICHALQNNWTIKMLSCWFLECWHRKCLICLNIYFLVLSDWFT